MYMSGGHFGYKQYEIVEELFGYYDLSLDYGEDGFKQSKKAAQINPFDDVEMSEMFWDMMCVVHSLDWYLSGDTGEHTYREDVERFKKKWLGKTQSERLQHVLDIGLQNIREDVTKAFHNYGLLEEKGEEST